MVCCPFCGFSIRPVLHGISSCNNCKRVFDSCPFNRLLSAAWLVRRQRIPSAEFLIHRFGFSQKEAELIFTYVAEKCFVHEEFIRILKELAISECYETHLDLAS